MCMYRLQPAKPVISTRRSSPGTGQGQEQRGRLTLGLERGCGAPCKNQWQSTARGGVACLAGAAAIRGSLETGDRDCRPVSCHWQSSVFSPPCARSRVRQKEALGGAGQTKTACGAGPRAEHRQANHSRQDCQESNDPSPRSSSSSTPRAARARCVAHAGSRESTQQRGGHGSVRHDHA